ncbi:MAG: hypothetical protein KatS3mg068_0861 [Candidatus Sericytochromatia bacterium]|nr:MAG: hypothetical protein KatS3mg068_0861 [Candidatus Sericytochromatia bacterium]
MNKKLNLFLTTSFLLLISLPSYTKVNKNIVDIEFDNVYVTKK